MDTVLYERQLIVLLHKWRNANKMYGPHLTEEDLRNVMELLKDTSVLLVSFLIYFNFFYSILIHQS